MTTAEYRDTLKRLNWTRNEAAKHLGISLSSAKRYAIRGNIPTLVVSTLRHFMELRCTQS